MEGHVGRDEGTGWFEAQRDQRQESRQKILTVLVQLTWEAESAAWCWPWKGGEKIKR